MTSAPNPVSFAVPDALLDALVHARRVVFFTGAGVSEESGIPTFRSGAGGLWSRFDPATLATPDAFRANPARVWSWYEWRRAAILRARPNPAHQAIAEFQHHIDTVTVVTQNVDDLHERAGASEVLHLHGRLEQARCMTCAHPYAHPPRLPDLPAEGGDLPPPHCPQCGDPVRPGVVWFGEALPADAWDEATQVASRCDVFFSVGTSSLVYPAAQLPLQAMQHGATVVQVNPQPTPLDGHCAFNLRAPAGTVLTAVVSRLKERLQDAR